MKDGDHIVAGGCLFTRTPMALVREILRQRRTGLTLSRNLMKLISVRRAGVRANWGQFNRWLYAESRTRTDALLVVLADDFGLSPSVADVSRG